MYIFYGMAQLWTGERTEREEEEVSAWLPRPLFSAQPLTGPRFLMEYEVFFTGSCAKHLNNYVDNPSVGIILEGARNFRRWGLAEEVGHSEGALGGLYLA